MSTLYPASTRDICLFILDNGRMFPPAPSAQSWSHNINLQNTVYPIYAVLISHPQGYVLFDAGCHPNSMGVHGRWPSALQTAYPWLAGPQDMLLTRLSQLCVKPSDIRYVVCSHLHCDHAGNLEFFPHSEILVHEWEWHAAQRELGTGLESVDFVRQDVQAWASASLNVRTVPYDARPFELLPGLVVHNLGQGHSYGMLALEVNLREQGTIILASDAAYSADCYGTAPNLPQTYVSEAGYMQGVAYLQQLADSTSGTVWFGHDLKQFMKLLAASSKTGCIE
ncbi:N-acyl homoserine lactonase family protein [Alicyclobacillus fodiniaquatilis]|uniref:N-acyl homoserine lactonase family protein n=1 Tax=Alicyclobacillus fodiniaquatilis TaxID=1661150 RepID=A0ABW4JC66_9BACL